ncbi:MAG: ornithine carbamoyltransferase [Deltaproteobacteria bacterium]|nr:ornithine carbamoyltransferase [Deltaproteobacteria bacterium]
MKKRDFLTLADLSRSEMDALLKRSLVLKRRWKKSLVDSPLAGKSLGLIFDKPSTRTRVSFEVAMTQLGGHPVYLDPGTTQIKRGEPIADSARVLSRYLDGVVIRTFDQATVEEWGRWSSVPVINGLTDLLHPCQVFCDLLTIIEKCGNYKGLKIAYIGDGNNIANTWVQAAALLDIALSLACPRGYQPNAKFLAEATRGRKARIELTRDPWQAVQGSDVVYTDVWASMGQEKERKERHKRFQGYQVNTALLRRAKRGALVMHCLPAHAGEEISSEVLEGPQSVVFDQAENRLHGQKAILEWLLKK